MTQVPTLVPSLESLFDADHYALQWRGAFEGKALEHYLTLGWRKGLRPNPRFDPEVYRRGCCGLISLEDEPLLHYVRLGEAAGVSPDGFFDPVFHAKRRSLTLGGGQVLSDYLSAPERGPANGWFDPDWYLAQNPDVAAAGVDPESHYRQFGHCEGRAAGPGFDTAWYRATHMRGAEPSETPIAYHLRLGRAAGLPTTPPDETPAAAVRRSLSPAPWFEAEPAAVKGAPRARALAFYLPQFHRLKENDAWWGPGFTEWTNVARGHPRFSGHQQPRIPRDFGFYDLDDRSVMPRQVDAARRAGLAGFCFYYYNFDGRRLLERPVEAFLARPEIDFGFCLMWCNENWTRRWDGAEHDVLLAHSDDPAADDALIDDWIRHMADPRYLRIDGRPLLVIYRADLLADARSRFERWRGRFRQAGMSPLLALAQSFDLVDPSVFGLDLAVEFPPHKLVRETPLRAMPGSILDPTANPRVRDYSAMVRAAEAQGSVDYPLVRGICPSWDNDARQQGGGALLTGSDPSLFRRWADGTIDYANAHPVQGEALVFVNAWNEWAEGAYLEPDVHSGWAYLNALAKALSSVD